jgi:micrococcal nuclease
MKKQNYIYNAMVTNVVDGDTIDVLVDLGFGICVDLRVRLNGIDTPEINSSDEVIKNSAKLAKKFVLDQLMKQPVVIETFKVDKYGRYLADVYLLNDSTSINTRLLNEGLATPYFGGKHN